MNALRRISEATSRPTYILLLDALDDWPEALPFAGTPFSVLLVMDGRDVAEHEFRAWNTFARRAADQGMAYFSAWGPACERLHDLMDETVVGWEVIEENPAPHFIMTTWHDDEDLTETLRFLQHDAFSIECQQGDEPCIVVLVGRPDLLAEVRDRIGAASS